MRPGMTRSRGRRDAKVASQVHEQANELLTGFPLYPEVDLG